jgi:hypothetical protein
MPPQQTGTDFFASLYSGGVAKTVEQSIERAAAHLETLTEKEGIDTEQIVDAQKKLQQ